MKLLLTFLLSAIITLCGCNSTLEPATMEPGCASPGTLLNGEIAETARGYPYRFMVYLPPCYTPETEPGYPVIYFVPGRSSGPAAWFNAGINQTADALILAGEVPPFIMVASENTDSDPLAAEIYSDLIPYITANYNTLANRRYRAVAGGSLGGIAAYRLALQYPDTFSSAGIFGSGLVGGEDEQVKTWLAALTPENQPRFFFNVGEQDPLMLTRGRVLAALLNEYDVPSEFVVGEGAHTYEYWASNMATYFRWVAEDW
ncbi:MAG TPA: hypothetical protein DEH25_16270 [Chloroflexi bacterium]|nr:hypothetical protein [Chloroflexota bacterium]